MKILFTLLFLLSSISIVLADIPPISPKENKPNNEATCLGFVLLFFAITILASWILKRRSTKINE
ncbi:MAG: hypothetical protein K1X72_10850 [Pyrinomonadaceae bacterium]|nr:hypothetical protein [Pyrinomonadaceae bacterium]